MLHNPQRPEKSEYAVDPPGYRLTSKLERWINTHYIRTGLITLNASELAEIIRKAMKDFQSLNETK